MTVHLSPQPGERASTPSPDCPFAVAPGMVTADEVAEQLGDVLHLDVKAFAVPRAGWMDLGVEAAEYVAGTTSARDVFEAAQNAAKA